jgi:hypothetical protein
MSKHKAASVTAEPTVDNNNESVTQSSKPLVFISHDSRDAKLAEAFSNLLTGVSGGVLKSFRSSDKKGSAGIEYGSEWYTRIMTAGELPDCAFKRGSGACGPSAGHSGMVGWARWLRPVHFAVRVG